MSRSMEDTFEELYLTFVDSFDSVKEQNKKTKEDFQDVMETLYTASLLQFSTYMDSEDFDLADKWKLKMRVTAGEWYENNVQRKRDREAEEERRREREEERARQQQQQKIKERDENASRERSDTKRYIQSAINIIEKKINAEIDTDSLEKLNDLLEYIEGEIEELEEKIEDLIYIRRSAFEDQLDEITDLRNTVEEKIEAVKKAEAAKKRKEQNEKNKKKLEEMQSAWKNKGKPEASNTSAASKPQVKTEVCPQCGNAVDKDSKFCTSCGTKLKTVCKKCGAIIKASAKFCSACGEPNK